MRAMPSTTTFQPGELVLVAFPFTRGTGAKRRPALVLIDDGGQDIPLARVTTRLYTTAYDVIVADWRAAGLLAPSVVRLHKLATLERALIERSLGNVTDADRGRIAAALSAAFSAWGS